MSLVSFIFYVYDMGMATLLIYLGEFEFLLLPHREERRARGSGPTATRHAAEPYPRSRELQPRRGRRGGRRGARAGAVRPSINQNYE